MRSRRTGYRVVFFTAATLLGTTAIPDHDATASRTSPAEKEGPDLTPAIEIVEVKNLQEKTSIIAIQKHEEIRVLTQKPIFFSNIQNVQDRIKNYLNENNFPYPVAKKISEQMTVGYIKDFGEVKAKTKYPVSDRFLGAMKPSVTVWDGNGVEVDIKPPLKVNPFCFVRDLSKTYNGAAWMHGFMGMEDDPRPLNLEREFGKEFSYMVRKHEIAHCMGADEQNADYVAAKLLLKNHPDKQVALDFLKLYKAMRISKMIFQELNPRYYGCFMAVERAISEFKKIGHNAETEEQIWSKATLNINFDAQLIGRFVKRAKSQKFVEDFDFDKMSLYFLRASKTSKTSKERETARQVSESIKHMGHVIPPPSRPAMAYRF